MFQVKQIDFGKYSVIVYSCSYDSPLSYLFDVEK